MYALKVGTLVVLHAVKELSPSRSFLPINQTQYGIVHCMYLCRINSVCKVFLGGTHVQCSGRLGETEISVRFPKD